MSCDNRSVAWVHRYYEILIENHTTATKWYRFQWLLTNCHAVCWVTFNQHFEINVHQTSHVSLLFCTGVLWCWYWNYCNSVLSVENSSLNRQAQCWVEHPVGNSHYNSAYCQGRWTPLLLQLVHHLWGSLTAGHLHPRFGVLPLATITLSPAEQQKNWLEDTVCLELIRHKYGSIVSISKISDVIVSNCSSLTVASPASGHVGTCPPPWRLRECFR